MARPDRGPRCTRLDGPFKLAALAGAVALLVFQQVPAMAQFQSGSGDTASGATSAPGQPSSKAFGYADVQFEVIRLVPDPGTEGYRLILTMTETKSPRRMATFVPPEATLMDNMGNVYFLTGATGVRICAFNENWDTKAVDCMNRKRAWNDLTQLATGVPMPVTLEFAPRDGSVIPETRDAASTLTLNASLAIVEDDGGQANGQQVDIVIPAIPLP